MAFPFPHKLALVALVLLLSFGVQGCREPEPVRIGFLGGLTGRAAGLGVSGRNGFLLAVEQANAAGGIRGQRIDPVIGDDRMDAEAALAALRELLDSKVVAVVGPMTSQIATAIVPEVNRARVPIVSPTVSTNQLSGLDDYFLRVYYSNAQAAGMLAEYLANRRGHPRLAAIYDRSNRAYTEDWIKAFRGRYEQLGGQLLAAIPFDPAEGMAFGTLTDRVLAEKPQGILLLANAVDSAMIAQQLAKRDATVSLYATGWSYADDLLQLGGKSVEGLLIIQSANQESRTPEFQAFRQQYSERYHAAPNFPALHAYDATRAVIAAVTNVEGSHRQLKEALLELPPTAGAQGIIAFDRFGDLRNPELHLAIIEEGAYRALH